jgi:hypothetical protein
MYRMEKVIVNSVLKARQIDHESAACPILYIASLEKRNPLFTKNVKSTVSHFYIHPSSRSVPS